MKKSLLHNIVIFILALGITSCASNSSESDSKASKAKAAASNLLAPQQFKEKMDALTNELLIDLRSHGELHSIGPIREAQNLDFNSGRFQAVIPQLDKNQPIMLYCAGGNRSSESAKLLKDAGFKEVYDLQGGITAWKNAGLPVARHSH